MIRSTNQARRTADHTGTSTQEYAPTGVDVGVDDREFAEVESDDWLVKGVEVEDWLVADVADVADVVLTLAGPHLLPTLKSLSRSQLKVLPCLFKKETLPFLFTLTQATCCPSSVPHISSFCPSFTVKSGPLLVFCSKSQSTRHTRTILAIEPSKRLRVACTVEIIFRPYHALIVIIDDPQAATENDTGGEEGISGEVHSYTWVKFSE